MIPKEKLNIQILEHFKNDAYKSLLDNPKLKKFTINRTHYFGTSKKRNCLKFYNKAGKKE